MRQLRFYIPSTPIVGETLLLPQQVAHHVAKVLRLSVGAELILFCGDGYEYEARLTELSKKVNKVKILSKQINNRESQLRLSLFQCISRGERMDMVFQKCVELGVSDFYPLYSQHTSVNIKQERISQKLAHWSGVITSACEQSGRTILPQLHPPMDFAQAITQVAFDGVKIILDPLADFKLSEVSLEQPAKLALYIGPEGGFSADELVFAKANGCIACGLGPRILRTETAAITGVSILQAKWGDL